MEKNLFLPLVLGTNREGRNSESVANLVLGALEQRMGVETRLFDVREFAFPQDNYGQAVKDQFPEWRDAVARADGLVIVSPEYNHGYPGILKTLLDTLYDEYARKPVGLVSVSMGPSGGVRMIENLLPVVTELGLIPLHKYLQFPHVQHVFDEQGKLKDGAYEKRIADFLEEMECMARTLKWGRDNNS